MNDTAALPRLGTGQVLAPRRGVAAQADLVLDRLARLPVGVTAGGHPEGERLRGHAAGGGGEANRNHRRGGRVRLWSCLQNRVLNALQCCRCFVLAEAARKVPA